MQEGVDQGGVDVTGDIESQVARFERFRGGLLSLIERGANSARCGEFRAELRQRRIIERQRHPATAEVGDQRFDRTCRCGIAQVCL